VRRWQGGAGRVLSLAFSPDGRCLASATKGHGPQGEIAVREVETGKNPFRATGGACVAFSPDGRLLAAGGEGPAIHLWEVATRRELPSLEGHRGPVRSLAFSPDGGRLASGSTDTTVLVWDVAEALSPRPAGQGGPAR
jgi:WD40 repeat protein